MIGKEMMKNENENDDDDDGDERQKQIANAKSKGLSPNYRTSIAASAVGENVRLPSSSRRISLVLFGKKNGQMFSM